MDPKFAAWLVIMAINEGMDLAEFMSQLRASGAVPDETWDDIEEDLRTTNDAWRSR